MDDMTGTPIVGNRHIEPQLRATAAFSCRWYGKACVPNHQEIAYPPELGDAEAAVAGGVREDREKQKMNGYDSYRSWTLRTSQNHLRMKEEQDLEGSLWTYNVGCWFVTPPLNQARANHS